MGEYIDSFETDKQLIKKMEEYSKHLSILLVEDNKTTQELYLIWIRKFFTSYDVADNGQEALDLYEPNKYDIILTDIKMPVMDGIAFIEKVREVDSNQVFVVLSSVQDSESFLELIRLSVDRFIPKSNEMFLFLFTLQKVSKEIYNSKKMHQLENTVTYLQNKQIAAMQILGDHDTVNSAYKAMSTTPYTIMSSREFFTSYNDDFKIEHDKILDLEEDAIIQVEKFVNDFENQRGEFFSYIDKYAFAINRLFEFQNLAFGIASISHSLKDETTWRDHKDALKELLFAIFSDLVKWRKALFIENEMVNIHEFDNSMITNTIQIEALFSNSKIEDNIEFFSGKVEETREAESIEFF